MSRPESAHQVVCPRCGLHFEPRSAPPVAARRTVLVAEGTGYFHDVARDALTPHFEVRSARTVEEARTSLAAGGIDLMLLDPHLSGSRQGLRLLAELRSKPCPILIFTAEDASFMDDATWKRLQGLGADDVVFKGMNSGESILRKAEALLSEPRDGGDAAL
jgi:DNA-binding response OmpR family regulator